MAEPLRDLWKICAEEMREREEKMLLDAFEAEDWRMCGAAKRLGIGPSTLQWVLKTRHPAIERSRKRHPVGRPARAA
jgi:transcriptional regulator of acetoin/glycerol metabolism